MDEQNEQPIVTPPPPPGALAEQMAAIVGAASITFGCWQVYHPAGFIVGGAIMLTGAWLSARQASI